MQVECRWCVVTQKENHPRLHQQLLSKSFIFIYTEVIQEEEEDLV